MRTPLDRAMNSKVLQHNHQVRHRTELTALILEPLLRYSEVDCDTIIERSQDGAQLICILHAGFAGMVTAAAVWSIWGSDLLPAAGDPTGGE